MLTDEAHTRSPPFETKQTPPGLCGLINYVTLGTTRFNHWHGVLYWRSTAPNLRLALSRRNRNGCNITSAVFVYIRLSCRFLCVFITPSPSLSRLLRFHHLSAMSTKAERLAHIPKIIAAINSGKDEDIDAVFAQDFKMIVPGTGGREAKDMPLPPGIDGTPALLPVLSNPRPKGGHRCLAQRIQ